MGRLLEALIVPSCAEVGHSWRHIGGKNAGCEIGNGCGCSVPVYECTRCHDCDYGDNTEAAQIRDQCRELYPREEG